MQHKFRDLTLSVGIEADLRVNHGGKELRLAFRKELDIDLPGQARKEMATIADDGENRGRSQLVIAGVFVEMRGFERHRIAGQCLFRSPFCILGR